IQLFSLLSNEECDAIVRRLKRRDFPPSHYVVREGQAGDSMYFITAGKCEVRKKDPATGIEFLLTELGPGQCFGEMALLTGKPRTASVVTTEPTTAGILERADFEDLLIHYPKMGLSLTRNLADRLETASEQVGIEYLALSKVQFDPRVLGLLPEQTITQHKVLPVAFINNRLTLAMVNPNNLLALDDVRRFVKGVMIEPVVCTEEDFQRFLSGPFKTLMKKDSKEGGRGETAAAAAPASAETVLQSLQSDSLNINLEEVTTDEAPASVTELRSSAEDAPVVRLANAILALAVRRGASDIHVEPQEKEVLVRFRIDGVLQPIQTIPKKAQMGLVSRIKILSKMDIAEKRLPQDGRISVRLEERGIDFRVSTIPSKWGEKVCMRILDKSNTQLGLDKLITDAETLERVREMVNQPYGILYVTGPTGSGKTTTLYSALAELNSPDINISTVEDPIEYDLGGINQVQVKKEIGLDFARVLRAFLRQDPDVILVGETRDLETGKIAVEAALTGHMVFTTLHTNDAAGTFIRLDEMGIEPFLVASSTIGIIAQRLARRLCQGCREAYTVDAETLRFLGAPTDSPVTFYKPRGCDGCGGSGYKGRVGIYEVLRMTAGVRGLVIKRGNTDEIREAARREGMLTLKDYGLMLLKEGLTSLDEVLQCVVVQE
ncbi:MAG: Flp pilus assembly complex ATPase component TadA, partial [Acidobacteria bacterium]|nr:Flp pilus assembly complex ATPase component TadA [Acidobacteriota bacterium]